MDQIDQPVQLSKYVRVKRWVGRKLWGFLNPGAVIGATSDKDFVTGTRSLLLDDVTLTCCEKRLPNNCFDGYEGVASGKMSAQPDRATIRVVFNPAIGCFEVNGRRITAAKQLSFHDDGSCYARLLE